MTAAPPSPDHGPLRGLPIALTGSGGYVGGALRPRLEALGATVRPVPRTALTDIEAWEAILRACPLVIHLAAQTSIYTAEADPDADRRANVASVESLIAAAVRTGARPAVLAAGSVTQVGIPDPARLPVDEIWDDRPASVYDRHKCMAESALKAAAADGRLTMAAPRLSNVYGPGPASGAADRSIVNKMVGWALEGRPLTVYGEGTERRDHSFIDDVTDGFLDLGAALLAGGDRTAAVNGRHFLLCTGTGTSMAEGIRRVAERVAVATGEPMVPVSHAPWPEGAHPIEFRHFIGDATALESAVGRRPSTPFVAGLDRTVGAALGRHSAATA